MIHRRAWRRRRRRRRHMMFVLKTGHDSETPLAVRPYLARQFAVVATLSNQIQSKQRSIHHWTPLKPKVTKCLR